MDGIVNILKPPGMTSFDVVGFLRRIYKTKAIGHTGTLDPGAVGVLPVCIGHATKAIEFMTEHDKVYRAEMTLGVATDTQDSYGKVLEAKEVNATEGQIAEVVMSFVGTYNQLPPMYSALKVDGKKLCDLARAGITVQREPRKIEIKSIKILHIKDNKVIFDVHCSKGTYIRTLCADIGDKLGCGAHMSFLIRSRAGTFHISSAISLEKIIALAENNRLEESLTGIDVVFYNLDKITVDGTAKKKILNGAVVELDSVKYKRGELIRVYDSSGVFIALGEIVSNNGKAVLKSKKLMINNNIDV